MTPALESAAVDASPLIILAQGQRLELLRLASERIIVPQRVAVEVRRAGPDDPAARALESIPWLEIVETESPPSAVQQYGLDPGEAAVLTWALARPGAVVIIDELRGRRAARGLGIPVVGTLGLIVEAKRRGEVPAARPVIDHLLRTTDWHISKDVIDAALIRIGE